MKIFYQSDSSLTMLMADPQIFPNARVVVVIFGFSSFMFNELSWNTSQWFDVKKFFLEESSFKVEFVLSADFFSVF